MRPPLICSRAREERGAVLIAGLLLALSLLMVIGAAVDLGQAFIVRRDLVSLADEAALAGSQAIDLEARHAGRVALEPGHARESALAALAGEPVQAQASATEQTVSVRLERRFPTVLLRLVGLRTLTVAARATAEPREP